MCVYYAYSLVEVVNENENHLSYDHHGRNRKWCLRGCRRQRGYHCIRGARSCLELANRIRVTVIAYLHLQVK